MFVKLVWVFIYCLVSTAEAEFELGYYWLDYEGGPIPTNALRVDNNTNVYVGQVYTKQYELLPASVRTSSPIATSNAHTSEFTSDSNVKVLCSQFLKNFKWVQSTAAAYRSLPNLVQGGTELGTPAFFGRAYVNGQAILGKLEGALTYGINGVLQYNYGPFDVLTYNRPKYSFCSVSCTIN